MVEVLFVKRKPKVAPCCVGCPALDECMDMSNDELGLVLKDSWACDGLRKTAEAKINGKS